MYDSALEELEQAILSNSTLLENLKFDLKWAETHKREVLTGLADDLRQVIKILEQEK